MIRWIKKVYQTITKGYSDESTWDLFYNISQYTLPRLKRLKELQNGIPVAFIPENYEELSADQKIIADETSEREWNKIFDDMIYALECCRDDDFDTPYTFDEDFGCEWEDCPDHPGSKQLKRTYGIHCDEKKQEEREKRIKKGLSDFGNYFRNLWW